MKRVHFFRSLPFVLLSCFILVLPPTVSARTIPTTPGQITEYIISGGNGPNGETKTPADIHSQQVDEEEISQGCYYGPHWPKIHHQSIDFTTIARWNELANSGVDG